MSARLCGLLVASSSAWVAAQDKAAVPGFEVVMWVDGATVRDDALWNTLRGIGVTAVSVGRGEDLAAPATHGMRFYVDQIGGKGELELRAQQWQAWFDGYLASRDENRLARPACLADQAVRERLLDKVREGASRAISAGAFGASLCDEASSTSHFNPIDVCASPAFRAAFRDELRRRCGGDLHALERRWGTALTDFAQIEPVTTEQIRRRELAGSTLPHNLAAWNDQLAFTDDLFVGLCRAGIDAAREVAPGLPVGMTGMQPPSAFGGHDYRRLMSGQRFFEVYDIGGARALASAVADPAALQFATLFPPQEGEPQALLGARIADLLVHGLSGVIVWSSREAIGGGAATEYGTRLHAALTDLAAVTPVFAGAQMQRSPVWIVESMPSVRAQWMLDSWDDGDTWPRRLSSYESRHGTSLQGRASWVALLRDLGLQPDFVFAEDLPDRLRATPPRLLVLADTLALADASADAIGDFVERGGHVLADHGTAVYDDALHLRDQGALDALFGVRSRSLLREDWRVRNAQGDDTLRTRGGAAIAERGLRGALAEPLDAADVQIEATHGRGRATLLNLAVCEYAAMRLDRERFGAARELRARVRQVVGAAGVEPPFWIRGEGLPTAVERTLLRSRDGRTLAAIQVDLLDDPTAFADLQKGGEREVELVFPSATRVTDLRRGVTVLAGPSCRVVLSPALGAFLVLEQPK